MWRQKVAAFSYRTQKYYSTKNKTPLQNAGPLCSHLKSRSVIRFSGPDTVNFLQGLVTNDMRQFADPVADKVTNLATSNLPTVGSRPVYAALLTGESRFLYDFFFYRAPRADEKLDRTGSGPGAGSQEVELFADVDASLVDDLLVTLRGYRLRAKVDVENVGTDFCCWQRYGGDLSDVKVEEPESAGVGWAGSVDGSSMSSSQGSEAGWQWFKDPRLDCLGFRGIFPSGTPPPLVEADKETSEEHYLLWRLEQGVAEGPHEIPIREAIPLEYNLAGLNAISFDKGCYVGQELVARTHHRGVVRKRLLPLKFVDSKGKEVKQKVAAGAVVVGSNPLNKPIGEVTTALGSRGLGVLRWREAIKNSGELAIQGNESVKVEFIRPKWWPSEWFPNE